MELSLLLVADYASSTSDGKLYMMGVFDQIRAVSFPVKHPDMYLVVKLSADPSEYGRYFKLDIKIVDESDKPVVPALAAGATIPVGEQGQKLTLNSVFKLANITFPKPGTYRFLVEIDQVLKGSLLVDLVQVAPVKV